MVIEDALYLLPGLYLYHNLPILQIHNTISYQISRTDTHTDIHSLYQLVYACVSCALHRAHGKFETVKLEALSSRRCAVLHLSRSQISEQSKLLQC